jgi:uncharacterized protein (DUF4415 family)
VYTNIVRFLWDPAKSERNLVDRGFDFAFASLVFAGPTLERIDTRQDYGEVRRIALGVADEIPLTVVFTDRAEAGEVVRRIISARGSSAVSAKRTAKSSRVNPPPRDPSQGRADLAQLRRVSDAEIARTAPEELRDLPADFWDDAVPVLPPTKVPISLRVDADVLEFFRESGPRYQSRMNAVLRSYMERAAKVVRKGSKRRGIA